MVKTEIATGVVHKVPADLKEALISNPDVLGKWNSLTPLTHNEWICWTTIVKKPEKIISIVYVQIFLKESVGLVVGQVVPIVNQMQKNGSNNS